MKKIYYISLLLLVALHSRATNPVINVTLSSDASPSSPLTGELRWAIEKANADAGADVIHFNISGSIPIMIQLQTELPAITEELSIYGYTQPGTSTNPKIIIDGSLGTSGFLATGLIQTGAGNCNYEGLQLQYFTNVYTSNGSCGNNTFIDNVFLNNTVCFTLNTGFSNSTFKGNYINTNKALTVTTTAQTGFSFSGSPLPANVTIGGPGSGDKNYIYNCSTAGVDVDGGEYIKITNNVFAGNGKNISLRYINSLDQELITACQNSNHGKRFPVFSAAFDGSSLTQITGSCEANDIIEIYKSNSSGIDALVLLGTVTADGAGLFSLSLSGLIAGDKIVCTSTDANNNTSAFSPGQIVAIPPCNNNGFVEGLSGFTLFFKLSDRGIEPPVTPQNGCTSFRGTQSLGTSYSGLYLATVCAGVTFTLGTSDSYPQSPVYNWDFGDNTTATGIPVTHSYAAAGSYSIIVTASGGPECIPITQTISVTVEEFYAEIYVKSGKGGGKNCAGVPMIISTGACSDVNATFSYNFGDGTSGVGNPLDVNHTYSSPGAYNVVVTITSPSFPTFVTNTVITVEGCTEITACKDCIGSFSPESGSYVVSLWVKEDGPGITKTSYDKAGIKISFDGDPTVFGPFYPDVTKNKIIDGWQRIEQEFQVPTGITKINIELVNDNNPALNVDCYFDDIRIFPLDGSMKSYVYDPVTLRLSAELDERNYATFYEYDEEGKLIRVKKETERGIMTIKEARNNTKKK